MSSAPQVTVRPIIPEEGIVEICIRAGHSEICGFANARREVARWAVYWRGRRCGPPGSTELLVYVTTRALRCPTEDGAIYVHRGRVLAAAYTAWRKGRM